MVEEVLAPISARDFYGSLGSDEDRVNVRRVVEVLVVAGDQPFASGTVRVTATAGRIDGFGDAITLAVEGRPRYPSSPESDSNLVDGFKDEGVMQLMRRFPLGAIEFWNYEPWQWPIIIKPKGGAPISVEWSKTPVTPVAVLYPASG